MDNCTINIYLAYGMLVYILASIYYIIRTLHVGTPFKDSLTIEQLSIQKQSAKVRKQIFCEGVLISIIGLLFTKPFKNC